MRWAFLAAASLLISLPVSAAVPPDGATTAPLPAPGASATATVPEPAPPALSGPEVYHQTCVACHGEDGRGVVAGTPDLTRQGGVLSKPDATLIKHIAQGFQNPGSPLAMPARGGNPALTDAEIAEVVAYLHTAFGPQASAAAATPAGAAVTQPASGPSGR